MTASAAEEREKLPGVISSQKRHSGARTGQRKYYARAAAEETTKKSAKIFGQKQAAEPVHIL
jgi:hypothetical protein